MLRSRLQAFCLGRPGGCGRWGLCRCGLERALRHRPLGSADRGLATELAYGAIRWRQWLDAWIDKLGKVPARKQPPRLRWLLHIGLYQLLRMERIPAAAVNTSVELAKTTKLARLAPVVNGLLRAALRAHEAGEGLPVPETPADRLAQDQSLPQWFSRELLQWCGEQAQQVALACNQVPRLICGSIVCGRPLSRWRRRWRPMASPRRRLKAVPMGCGCSSLPAICVNGLAMTRGTGVCRIERRSGWRHCCLHNRGRRCWMPALRRGQGHAPG